MTAAIIENSVIQLTGRQWGKCFCGEFCKPLEGNESWPGVAHLPDNEGLDKIAQWAAAANRTQDRFEPLCDRHFEDWHNAKQFGGEANQLRWLVNEVKRVFSPPVRGESYNP